MVITEPAIEAISQMLLSRFLAQSCFFGVVSHEPLSIAGCIFVQCAVICEAPTSVYSAAWEGTIEANILTNI